MILNRLLPIVVFVALAAVAGAQEMFVPSGATFVDAAGPHETYQSLQAPPIEVTDLGSTVSLLMGNDVMELIQEPDNPLEYRYSLKGKGRGQKVITRAYREAVGGKIVRVTVTTLKPSKQIESLTINFTPEIVGLPKDSSDN